ncbi:MAG: NUDIX domain-containing protein [Candidatus Roizmanbacteria bacterium]|nr:MAG: NUDIX domain-containing protein [Candidatus Roizmanbacteria bacterium]
MKYKTETSAGGIVYKKENGKILWLITQHSQNKGWSFPKGLIGDTKQNEPMEEAALREVGEEGGIKAKIVNPQPVETKYKYRFQDTLVDKTVNYFLMEYISGDPADHDWEVSEALFLTEEEVKKTLTFKADQEAFKKILKQFKSKN